MVPSHPSARAAACAQGFPVAEAMNEMEVQAQINQMVQFIHQEAKEKAAEIKLKTDEEFSIEKLRMVEADSLGGRFSVQVRALSFYQSRAPP